MTNPHLKKKLDNLYKWIDAMENTDTKSLKIRELRRNVPVEEVEDLRTSFVVIEGGGYVVTVTVTDNDRFSCLVNLEGKEDERPVGGYLDDKTMTEINDTKCPNCDGTGLETVEIFKPQNPDRDVGEPYEELRKCETCDGSGEINE